MRNSHDGAPGRTGALNEALLRGMLEGAGRHSFRISEIAGSIHPSANLRQSKGVALHVD
jgi:hypothetical protein